LRGGIGLAEQAGMSAFRQHLLHRLLLATAIGTVACGTDVQLDQNAASGGNGGSGGATANGGTHQGGTNTGGNPYPPPPDSYTSTKCFDWPQPQGEGGAGGGAAGSAGHDGRGGAGGIAPCPGEAEAATLLMIDDMIGCSATIQSEGTFMDGQCCYTVLYQDCGVGRPFLDDRGRAVTARRARSGAWTAGGARPSLAGLSVQQREALAARWRRDAFLEHASVASFGRFALELLAVGAPAHLIAAAHAAALDEVRHAQRCFDLARAYGDDATDPGPMPMGGSVTVSSDPADIARRAVIEGCVGETLAAVLASEQHALAQDPAVRETLAVIAEDEARHAELAWAAVAWLIQSGGPRVRDAVAKAFDEALAAHTDGTTKRADENAALEAHGLIDAESERRLVRNTLEQIVAPVAARLAA
jgi:hypothetical protein